MEEQNHRKRWYNGGSLGICERLVSAGWNIFRGNLASERAIGNDLVSSESRTLLLNREGGIVGSGSGGGALTDGESHVRERGEIQGPAVVSLEEFKALETKHAELSVELAAAKRRIELLEERDGRHLGQTSTSTQNDNLPIRPRRRCPVRGQPSCRECNMVFKTASSKCVHMQRKHEGKVWKCQYCNQAFTSPSGKSVHVKNMHRTMTNGNGGITTRCKLGQKKEKTEV